MPKAEADIRASHDAVIDDVDSNQRIYGYIGEVARATRELVDTVEHRFEQVDQQFEQVDRRFEQVDRRFEQVDRRFEQVEHRFEQVDQRFEQVDRRLKQVDRRFEQLESRLDAFQSTSEKHFGVLTDSINKLDARIERLVPYIVRDELKGERRTAT